MHLPAHELHRLAAVREDQPQQAGEITGQLLSMPDAIAIARETFGTLLSPTH